MALEIHTGGTVYLNFYIQHLMRFADDDYDTFFDRPIISMVVEKMLFCFSEETQPEERLKQVASFFFSKHFAEIPYQWLSTRMFATLKDMVKRGAYMNREKAAQRLSGVFHDIQHIAMYAPYCDAFIMDQPMAALVSDPHICLEKRYGVRAFSLNTWNELLAWLDIIEKEMNDDRKAGLSAAYPTTNL